MTFPTIPTAGAGRVLSVLSTDTSGGTVTSPNLSSLTKNAGDLLIAIVITYDGNSTDAEFSSWGGGFTEFEDEATTSTMAIGCAYKISTGSETGTFTVAVAGGAAASDAAFFLLSIPGAHASAAPEANGYATGTTSAADPTALTPSWGAADTLWIAVGGSGETGTGGSYTGIASAPTNYTDYADSGMSADAIGAVEGAVAFRQLNAASEDAGAFTTDVSNARSAALLVAVRPATVNPSGTGAISVPAATTSGTGEEVFTATGATSVPPGIVAGTGEEVFTATGAVAVPAATVAGSGNHEEPSGPTGTGAISVPTATVAGVGEEVFTATGAVSVPMGTVAGTGSEVFTGTGSISAPTGTVAGSGTEILTATGAIDVQSGTVVGAGTHTENPTGTGAIAIPVPVVNGTGSLILAATGVVLVPTATVVGVGDHGFNMVGTGALQAPTATVAGDGLEVLTATGAVSAPTATVAGDGLHSQALAGTGGVSVPAATVSGVGSVTVVGGQPSTIVDERLIGSATIEDELVLVGSIVDTPTIRGRIE